jgi:hypothetical protein
MKRRKRWRQIVIAVVLLVFAGLLLRACPAIRDGVPGQLAKAQQDSESATHSGLLAVRLWSAHRSTRALAAVQVQDARDEVAKAFKEVAALTTDTDADRLRQRGLTAAMTEAIDTLNDAGATIRGVPSSADPTTIAQRLEEAASGLAVQADP